MDTRVLFLVLIIAGFGMFVNVVVTNPTELSRDISYDITQLFQDCNISNPVTFTECLRRVKRQARLHESDAECWGQCMPDCEKKGKDLASCAEDCAYCKHRTARYIINRLINITESGDEDTKRSSTPIVNVTNHIHVHNHYNTSAAQTGASPNKINDNQQNCPCYFITWLPCYCRSQYSMYQYPYQLPFIPLGGYTGNNCVCPDKATQCDECNPPFR